MSESSSRQSTILGQEVQSSATSINYFHKALQAAREHSFTEAQLLLANELTSRPTNAAAWYLWGSLTSSPEFATLCLRQVVRLSPNHFQAITLLEQLRLTTDPTTQREFEAMECDASGIDLPALWIARETIRTELIPTQSTVAEAITTCSRSEDQAVGVPRMTHESGSKNEGDTKNENTSLPQGPRPTSIRFRQLNSNPSAEAALLMSSEERASRRKIAISRKGWEDNAVQSQDSTTSRNLSRAEAEPVEKATSSASITDSGAVSSKLAKSHPQPTGDPKPPDLPPTLTMNSIDNRATHKPPASTVSRKPSTTLVPVAFWASKLVRSSSGVDQTVPKDGAEANSQNRSGGLSSSTSAIGAAFFQNDVSLWQAGLAMFDKAGDRDNRVFVALAYLAGLSVAEVLTVFVDPRIGVVAHLGLMLVMMFHAVRRWEQPDHFLWLSLTTMPLIRIISLSLPLIDFSLSYWFLYTSIPLFASAIVVMRIGNLTLKDVGLTASGLPLQLAIGLIGIPLGYIEYLILKPEPLILELTWQQLWWPALIILISTGLLEELVFRGIVQQAAVDQLGPPFGITYVAVFFAVLHIGYRSLTDVVFVLAVGLLFGWLVYRTKNIVGVTIAHGLTNIFLFLVMPFASSVVPFGMP